MTYRIADGVDQEANFADVAPQPRCPGILATRRMYSLNRTVYEDGLYTYWEYETLDDTTWNSLLSQFGISDSTKTNQVTIRTAGNARTFVNKNGTIVYPEIGVDATRIRSFWKNVRFYIVELSDT